jgi:hypothetical protein
MSCANTTNPPAPSRCIAIDMPTNYTGSECCIGPSLRYFYLLARVRPFCRKSSRGLAGAHGNRTHQEPVSRPLTGFEDRTEHQLRKRSPLRQQAAEHEYTRRNPLFPGGLRSSIPEQSIPLSRQEATDSDPKRPLRAVPALSERCQIGTPAGHPFRSSWRTRIGGCLSQVRECILGRGLIIKTQMGVHSQGQNRG